MARLTVSPNVNGAAVQGHRLAWQLPGLQAASASRLCLGFGVGNAAQPGHQSWRGIHDARIGIALNLSGPDHVGQQEHLAGE